MISDTDLKHLKRCVELAEQVRELHRKFYERSEKIVCLL